MEENQEELNEDLKKYFDPEKYITKIVSATDTEEEEIAVEDAPVKGGKVANLISLLTDPANKEFKEKTLLTLKKDKGEELLLLAIATAEAKEKRHLLVAAAWESEINFSKYLPFFIILALDPDYLVSLEAITVISTMEGPFNKDHVTEGIKKVKAAKQNISNERVVLLTDLIVTLEDFIRE